MKKHRYAEIWNISAEIDVWLQGKGKKIQRKREENLERTKPREVS